MDDELLPELEYIGVLIEAIAEHWRFLSGEYPTWEGVPAVMLPPGLMRQLCADRWEDELLRRRLRLDPDFVCPVADFLPALLFAGYESERPAVDDLRGCMRRSAAADAYQLARKACAEALDQAELNKLGWLFTELVALGSGPVKDALRQLAAKSGSKGGKRSAELRREGFDRSAAATCKAARALLPDGSRSGSDLVRLLALRTGLSKPAVRRHLRTEGLYPEARKKNV